MDCGLPTQREKTLAPVIFIKQPGQDIAWWEPVTNVYCILPSGSSDLATIATGAIKCQGYARNHVASTNLNNFDDSAEHAVDERGFLDSDGQNQAQNRSGVRLPSEVWGLLSHRNGDARPGEEPPLCHYHLRGHGIRNHETAFHAMQCNGWNGTQRRKVASSESCRPYRCDHCQQLSEIIRRSFTNRKRHKQRKLEKCTGEEIQEAAPNRQVVILYYRPLHTDIHTYIHTCVTKGVVSATSALV